MSKEFQVQIFDPTNRKDLRTMKDLLSGRDLFEVLDTFSDQAAELFQIRQPALKKGTVEFRRGLAAFIKKEFKGGANFLRFGRWVYFSWRGVLAHLLPPDLFFELRTNRNRNMLTCEEQKKYAAFTVGVCGLSVGNSIAATIAVSGGSRTMKLSDPDDLSLSNLNRIRASVTDLSLNKCYLSARQILEMDPYARIITYPKGLNEKNLPEFFGKDPKISVAIDALDDLPLKVKIRLLAQKLKVPVIMVTDCGEGVLLDVERYDLNQPIKPFLGRVSDQTLKRILAGKVGGKERLRAVAQIVDLNNVSARKTQSLSQIGKTLYTWPQLGSSIQLCGVAAAFAVQKIALGEELRGSSLLSLEETFLSKSDKIPDERKRAATEFLKA